MAVRKKKKKFVKIKLRLSKPMQPVETDRVNIDVESKPL